MNDSSRNSQHLKTESTGLFAFFPAMGVEERRAFWACFGGWTLDAMDFMLYPLVISTIITLWNIPKGQAGLIVTATLLSSAAGGWVTGYFGDRIGRVRCLQFTILWYAGFTLLCAIAQNYAQLFAFRALLGLGFGGEWAVGAVLIGETVRPHHRGRAVGVVQSGWAVGWGLAVILQVIAYLIAPPHIAWRLMFAFGVIPAILVYLIRRYVQEPEIAFETHRRATDQRRKPQIWEIFSADMLRTTIFAAMLGTGAQGGYYAVTTWVPTFLRKSRHLTVIGSSGYLALIIGGSLLGYLTGAWLADRIGRRLLFFSFAVAASILTIIYTQVPISNSAMLALSFPLGFCASAYFSGVGPFLTELYPTRLRGSGQGFAYNFGRGIGAVFPTLVGLLASAMSLGAAIAVFAIAAYALMVIAAAALPETRGKRLVAD